MKHITFNLRIQNLCILPQIKTRGYGQQPVSFRGSIFWNTLDDWVKKEHFRPSKRGSKIGLVISAPAKYVVNFNFDFIKYIFFCK